MFILTQDMSTIVNTEHIVKITTGATMAPSITAHMDTGEVIHLGDYLPEDDVFRDRKLVDIFERINTNKTMFIPPYSSDKPKPGEFIEA